MKIICISDTHCQLSDIRVPGGKNDILIHAGDSTYRGDIAELTKFNEDLGKLPHKYKIVISGNHDWLFQTDPSLARSLMTNCTYLQDESIIIEGLKIYGAPWQPEFGGWAFNLPRGIPLREKWALIPPDTDILVTHGPPLGQGDMTLSYNGFPREQVGCWDLATVIQQIKPKLHIFGHIHCGHGVTKDEHTTYINAAICDEQYDPIQKPIEVKYVKGTFKIKS